MAFKNIYIVEENKIEKLLDYGFSKDITGLDRYLMNTDNEYAIYVDLDGVVTGVERMILWNDKTLGIDIKPYIQHLIDAGIVIMKVIDERELLI